MKPVCTIIAGVNGAGKTTFALDYLSKRVHYLNFINADLISFGLSPLRVERDDIRASRVFIKQINKAISNRENFALETTLSGKAYLKLIDKLQKDNWRVELIYLYLPDTKLSIQRVARRVKEGGHDIALETIIRRYPRSIYNFVNYYLPVCDNVFCFDNSREEHKVIFIKDAQGIQLVTVATYQKMLEVKTNE